MANFTVPLSVSQNIARAKSLLKRDEPVRALDALMTGLDLYDPSQLLGKARFEVEVIIAECVLELNRQPQIRSFIQSITKSDKAEITYMPKEEAKLRALLPIIRKGLMEAAEASLNAVKEAQGQRKKKLEEKAHEHMQAGDLARAKASLRRLAEEFGHEEGVLCHVGEQLIAANLLFDAVEFLEQAIVEFPKESKAYALATSSYITLREYDKGEEVYNKALKQFGKHPRTLLNLANLYVMWNKKEKAFETASAAITLDPSLKEAQEIVDKYS